MDALADRTADAKHGRDPRRADHVDGDRRPRGARRRGHRDPLRRRRRARRAPRGGLEDATTATPSPSRWPRPSASPCSTCRAAWRPTRPPARRSRTPWPRTVALVRQGDVDGGARQPPALHAARVRGLRREEPGRRGPVRGVQRGGVRAPRRRSPAAASAPIIIVAVVALLLAAACAVAHHRGITRGVAAILDRLALAASDHDTTDLSQRPGRRRHRRPDAQAIAATTPPIATRRRRRDRPHRPRGQRDPRQHRRARSRTTTRCARSSPG